MYYVSALNHFFKIIKSGHCPLFIISISIEYYAATSSEETSSSATTSHSVAATSAPSTASISSSFIISSDMYLCGSYPRIIDKVYILIHFFKISKLNSIINT